MNMLNSSVAQILSLFCLLTTSVKCLLFDNGSIVNNQHKADVSVSKPDPSFVRLSVVFSDGGRQTCGGVLVTNLWIFTTASCVYR